jgi:hypothetical protein
MPYYPKSQIKTNLYTSGYEYVYADSRSTYYVGSYYKLSSGEIYTGKFPGDVKSPQALIFAPYNNLEPGYTTPPNLAVPYSPLMPTKQNYQMGMYTRYFTIKRNQSLFTEISLDTYNLYKEQNSQVPWRLYRVFSLNWELTGNIQNVAQINQSTTRLVEYQENVNGLGIYLKENWTQYYKSSK